MVLGVPADDLAARRGGLRRARPGRARLAASAARHADRRVRVTVGGRGGARRAGARPRPGLGRGVVAHRRAARQPGLRRRGARRRSAPTTTRGWSSHPTFDPTDDVAAPYLSLGVRPKVAILREQGVNSHVETAFAFDRAGFDTYDVHMTDLQTGRFDLADVVGLVACGGFSYGDTLGRRRGLGALGALQRAAHRGLPRLLPPRRHLRPRHLQRLPDVRGARRPHPRRRGVAAVHPQPVRAVRGAADPGRGARVAVDPHRRHGRQPHPDRGGARRGLRRLLGPRRLGRGRRGWRGSSTTTARRRRPTRSTPTVLPAA